MKFEVIGLNTLHVAPSRPAMTQVLGHTDYLGATPQDAPVINNLSDSNGRHNFGPI